MPSLAYAGSSFLLPVSIRAPPAAQTSNQTGPDQYERSKVGVSTGNMYHDMCLTIRVRIYPFMKAEKKHKFNLEIFQCDDSLHVNTENRYDVGP